MTHPGRARRPFPLTWIVPSGRNALWLRLLSVPAKRLDVLELAKVTGHRDLRVLSRVYYAPDMQDVASKLD